MRRQSSPARMLSACGGLILIAATAVSGFVTSSAAAAATVPQAVTAVTITPTNPGLHDPVTVHVAFCIPKGSAEGDTFSLTLPPQLEALTAGFAVSDSTANTVAQAVVSSGVATFTLTTYASTHTGICGMAYFQAIMAPGKVKPNVSNTLAFTSAGQVFDTTLTPILTSVPSPAQPLLYGTWAIPALEDQVGGSDALTWYVQAPASPHPDGLSTVTLTDTAGKGQAIDCANVGVQSGTLDASGFFHYVSRYHDIASSHCNAKRVSLVTGSVPVGLDLRLVVATDVTKHSLAAFNSSGTVSADGGRTTVVAAPAVTRALAGGKASGAAGLPGTPTSAPSSSASAAGDPSSGVGFGAKAAIWLTVVAVALLGLVGLATRRRRA